MGGWKYWNMVDTEMLDAGFWIQSTAGEAVVCFWMVHRLIAAEVFD